MEKCVLVTGGAGYIGCNVVNCLVKKGYNVVVIDNFSNSYESEINKLKQIYNNKITIYNCNLLNNTTYEMLNKHNISCIIHLAGKKYIQESFDKEEIYYENNISATKKLLEWATQKNIKKFIFSSSITVYGDCDKNIVSENDNCNPLSPYAKQKLMGEQIIKNWAKETDSYAIVLRLSNPIGADAKIMLGEKSISDYKGLVPFLIDCVNQNKAPALNGNNHPTKDGTTIRDYVWVVDVANAFVLAVEYNLSKYEIFNVGTGGEGFSVLDILNSISLISEKEISYTFGPKRAGDKSIIITNNNKIKTKLKSNFNTNLNEILKTQYIFQKK